MARHTCVRCGVVSNTLEEHLCKDLKKRYDRQNKAIELIKGVIRQFDYSDYGDTYHDKMAAEILTVLQGRDLGFG